MLNTIEMVFVLAYEGFNFLLCCMFFFVTINEMPRRIAFQYDMLFRTDKRKWLTSQIYYCIATVLVYLCFLLLIAFVMSLCFAPWGTQWEGIPKLENVGVFGWITFDIVKNCSPLEAIILSLLPISFPLITISLFLLLSSLIGAGRIGILTVCFCIFADYISVQNSLPFSLTQYASLYALSTNEDVFKALFSMCIVYALIDIALYMIMRRIVSHADFNFQCTGQY